MKNLETKPIVFHLKGGKQLKMKNKHRGSSFDEFLKEEATFEECTAEAIRRVLLFQLEKELKLQP